MEALTTPTTNGNSDERCRAKLIIPWKLNSVTPNIVRCQSRVQNGRHDETAVWRVLTSTNCFVSIQSINQSLPVVPTNNYFSNNTKSASRQRYSPNLGATRNVETFFLYYIFLFNFKTCLSYSGWARSIVVIGEENKVKYIGDLI